MQPAPPGTPAVSCEQQTKETAFGAEVNTGFPREFFSLPFFRLHGIQRPPPALATLQRMQHIYIAIACGALCIAHADAYAWGNQGHRITGYIANAQLTASSKARLRDLLGTDDLSQIATQLDDDRAQLEDKIPGSSRWHYENRQICPQQSNVVAACPHALCITRQIETFMQLLRDDSATQAQQADAVSGLVHLIGDLHQPLHLADNRDRGGNDVLVLLPNEKTPRNLHAAWDTQFVRLNVRRRQEQLYATSLSAQYTVSQAAWRQGDAPLGPPKRTCSRMNELIAHCRILPAATRWLRRLH